ncbi:DUF1833 family protein [Oleispirillum naphthae]|uniref:DUF1833 family protein n=1 Tax=Oleispirillum naphthae TaxID=2838853 RepID=UPI0030825029
MPDPNLSEAIREAYASSPSGVVTLHTLELLHPNFDAPVRVVRNHADTKTWLALGGAAVQSVLDALDEKTRRNIGLVARLEASAPENPGEMVAWVALAFDVDLPEVATSAAPEATVTIDNVDQEITRQLDLAATSTEKIRMIYRPYISSDIEGPQADPPMVLTVGDVTVTDMQVSGNAGVSDVGNRAFPNETYTATRFPALAASQ